MSKKRIVGIDPGSSICGVVVLDDNQITGAFNWTIPVLWSKISQFLIHPNLTVVVEDIRPYSVQLMPQVIETCKLIGVIEDRLKNWAGINVELIPRGEVQRWAFESFNVTCMRLINKKIDKKMFLCCDVKTKELLWLDANGKPRRKGSFIYIDDKIMTEVMKEMYGIPMPKPGDGYKFGLKNHSWQALAVASLYSSRCK
jgi:hypothetical protein